MKKGITVETMSTEQEKITLGLDLGDKTSSFCILDSNGQIESEGVVAPTADKLRSWASRLPTCVIALEAVVHPMWVSRLLKNSDIKRLWLTRAIWPTSPPAPTRAIGRTQSRWRAWHVRT